MVSSSAAATKPIIMSMSTLSSLFFFLSILSLSTISFSSVTPSNPTHHPITTPNSSTPPKPKPKPWPHQFHSLIVFNSTTDSIFQVIDLWYDWPNGRNFNIIQKQLGELLYDLEWNNGTSFFYTLDANKKCSSAQLEVGMLPPNWLEGANYLGQQHVDGFLCNVWEKVDFIWYYEDVITKRPVLWIYYTGRAAHVMTFEVGAVLEDGKWQVPAYCFEKREKEDYPDLKSVVEERVQWRRGV